MYPNGIAMFAVSEVLQRARLDQGIDLATVAARTKIKAKYLQAIEILRDPKSLPGGFFYKSFAHQYATFLGVGMSVRSGQKTQYLSRVGRGCSSAIARRQPSKKLWSCRPGLGLRGNIFEDVGFWFSYWWLAWESMIGGTRAAVAPGKNREPRSGCQKHHRAESAKPRCRAGFTPFRFPSWSRACPWLGAGCCCGEQEEPAAPAGSSVELALTATEETWLSASSDGTPVFSGVLEANQTKTIEGKEFAELRVGNAAGLEVRLNGKPLGPLGAHGQVRDLAIRPDKFQFVSTPKESE